MHPATTGQDQIDPTAWAFYRRTMNLLNEASIPFLVGGAYALARYSAVERHTKDFDSFSTCVHLGGNVHDIPWRSHFACCPPASAAVCAAVGCPCSTPPLSLFELELEPDELLEPDLRP